MNAAFFYEKWYDYTWSASLYSTALINTLWLFLVSMNEKKASAKRFRNVEEVRERGSDEGERYSFERISGLFRMMKTASRYVQSYIGALLRWVLWRWHESRCTETTLNKPIRQNSSYFGVHLRTYTIIVFK